MARIDDFNDRQTQIDAESEPDHQYDYQTDSNGSWAGALPVKQYVPPFVWPYALRTPSERPPLLPDGANELLQGLV